MAALRAYCTPYNTLEEKKSHKVENSCMRIIRILLKKIQYMLALCALLSQNKMAIDEMFNVVALRNISIVAKTRLYRNVGDYYAFPPFECTLIDCTKTARSE